MAEATSSSPNQMLKVADLMQHNTANAVIQLKNGTLVAVESRVCETITVGNLHIPILKSDNEDKFKEINGRIGVTACGSKSRNEALWEYLNNKVGPNEDVTGVVSIVNKFLCDNRRPKRSFPLSAFIVGCPRGKEKVITYLIGDIIDPTVVNVPYHAIGGGGTALKMQLRDYLSLNQETPVDTAKEYLLHALFQSAIADVNCGGALHVWWITPNGCMQLTPNGGVHTIQAAIDVRHRFNETKEIFVFDRAPYQKMNHYFLKDCLVNLGIPPRHVSCLGYVKGKWKMFMVRFPNVEDIPTLYKITEKVVSVVHGGNISGVRKLTYQLDGEMLTLFVIRADGKTVVNTRNGNYLDDHLLPVYLQCI